MNPSPSLTRRTAGRLLTATTLTLMLAGPGAAEVATAQESPAPSAPAASPDPACGPMAAASPDVLGQPVAGSPVPSDTPVSSEMPVPSDAPSPIDTSSPEPDTGAGNAAGDVPDNAVFLTYHDPALGYFIDYVEGWQVTPAADGVTIRDKDSSETVRIMPLPADLAGCVTDRELPALQALPGFAVIAQDTVKVHGAHVIHLSYHLPAPPDPVTGKEVPSTVDRYYIPGLNDLAIISLSTPDGVDNVDAFRQMLRSFRWH